MILTDSMLDAAFRFRETEAWKTLDDSNITILFQTVKYQFVSFLLKIKSTSQPRHNKMRIN